jgi:divalent metal cation (Fe/Co/Zn/Cd) transporter
MNASDFSWYKIASIFGAAILLFICFVTIASGFLLFNNEHEFNGVITICSGMVCGIAAVLAYLNYQKRK